MTRTLAWITGAGLLMSAIALVGSVTLVLREATLKKLIRPLVALAAGSMIGGALFHMLPASVAQLHNALSLYVWVAIGFLLFFALEQFLHWHHCHKPPAEHRSAVGHLILIADAVHNFIDGLAIGAAFVIDVRLGVSAWIATAAHEVPQELGDFGVLIHAGWPKSRALLFNVLSALTVLLGGFVAYAVSFRVDVAPLIAFAAGNFLYVGAADLVPEVKAHRDWTVNLVHLLAFAFGLGLLLVVRLVFVR